jgi:uncharacterized protein YbjT (DUF2867 family)
LVTQARVRARRHYQRRRRASAAESVRRALGGVEVAYYLVHSLGTREFEARDRAAARTVAEEAARAGLSQLVYLGGLGDDSPQLSTHLRSQLETEQELASGAVPLTTLRAAIVIGRGSAGFETIVALVDRLPAMVSPRWVSVRTQPIAIADVVEYLAGLCGHPQAIGESFDAGGPEVMTYREMIERVGAERGKRPLIIEVPVLTPRLTSYWLHLVTPVKASIARPLIEGLRNETVAKDERIRELLPSELTPFDLAVRAALLASSQSALKRRRVRGRPAGGPSLTFGSKRLDADELGQLVRHQLAGGDLRRVRHRRLQVALLQHLRRNTVRLVEVARRLEQADRGQDAVRGLKQDVTVEARQLAQAGNQVVVGLAGDLGRTTLVDTFVPSDGGIHLLLLTLAVQAEDSVSPPDVRTVRRRSLPDKQSRQRRLERQIAKVSEERFRHKEKREARRFS